MTSKTLGHFEEQSDDRCEFLSLSFSPLSAPLCARWRNNGVSADFLGDYVTTFLPGNGGMAGAGVNQSEIRHAVTYIANEFLENAMKYHEHHVDIPIGIRLELSIDHVTVSVTNSVGIEQAQRYKAFAEDILKEDSGDLLVRQFEKNSAGPESTESCLGLLTMINDYRARIGWRFERHPAYREMMTVTTRAVLPLIDAAGVSA
jgi:hypothetical protein